MKSDQEISQIARRTLAIEAESITGLEALVDKDFIEAAKVIHFSQGRVVVTGIGKSAIIAQKIVATFNSTGTPAIFMHAADAIHGDLGIIQSNDVVICISKSGNTPEIKVLVPLIKAGNNKLIGMAGDTKSYLATHSDFVLNTTVEKEACPNNLAPTSSTAAQMAMGDALAVCLLECRGFTSNDFARFHPGGALGKRLYLKVSDIYPNNPSPSVGPDDSLATVIYEISAKRLGATAVLSDGKLAGIITDGDLRRMMEKGGNFDSVKAADIMTRLPKAIPPGMMAVEALQLMKQHNITQLVVAESGTYYGFVHLHDLLKEGIL
ncbi:MAG TPA: KpsF/GutQ family sugar-phosphate isomerase [Bacteroidia bacterium]|nr:KpsF/GutQ family sugar-phosphate isomerase [Bacteroidia bacterium]